MRWIGTVRTAEAPGNGPQQGRVPMKLTGAAASWPSAPQLLDVLATRYGDTVVDVFVSANGRFVGPPPTPHRWPMSQVVEHLRAGRQHTDDGIWYMQQLAFADLPGIDEILPPPRAADPAALRDSTLWLSPGGTTTGLHFDHWHNVLVVLSGEKRLKLFAPKWIDHLYVYPANAASPNVCRVDLEDPDFDRFPLLAEAEFSTCSLGPGEALYLPAYWFHHVQSDGMSVAANFWWTPPAEDCVGPPLARALAANYVYYQVDNLARMMDLSAVTGPLGRWLLARGDPTGAVLAAAGELIRALREAVEQAEGVPVEVPVNRERDLLDRAAPLLGVPVGELAPHLDLARRVRLRRTSPSTVDATAAVAAVEQVNEARLRTLGARPR